MKKWLIIAGVFIALIAYSAILHNQLKKERAEVSRVTNNYKAAEANYRDSSVVWLLNINELKSSNDSLIQNSLKLANELGIKNKRITDLQYTIDNFEIEKEIVFVGDTIFVETMPKIDTTIGDSWMWSLRLELEYPNIIRPLINVESRSTAIFHQEKQTIAPPKKFFLTRWLQRRHIITEVEVIEENTYITTKTNKFIHISK